MEQSYLMDTNAVVDYLDSRLPEDAAKAIGLVAPQISVITKMELLGWPNATSQHLLVLSQYINGSTVFALVEPVIEEAIVIRRTTRIKLPDAIIASTALVFDLSLVTRNVQDFKNITGLRCVHSHEFKI